MESSQQTTQSIHTASKIEPETPPTHHFVAETTLTKITAPRKGRNSVKLTVLSTVIPETPRPRESSTSRNPHQCTKFYKKEKLQENQAIQARNEIETEDEDRDPEEHKNKKKTVSNTCTSH